jgi:hypothetical protein
MQSDDMKPRTAIVAFNCKWSSLVLHGEIVANGSRPITDEIKSLREATPGQQIVEEVVQRFLGLCLIQAIKYEEIEATP